MAGKLSGIDVIPLAFERTKNQLIAPFRLRHWIRLALVCLLTGEITGGGGSWSGANFNLPPPSKSGSSSDFVSLLSPSFDQLSGYVAWAILAVIAGVLFGLVILYVSSIFRFILFDAVLNNRCQLRDGWRRWQRQGSSYFLWQIGFGMTALVGLGLLVGGPVFFAWQAGVFQNPDRHIALLIVGGVLMLCVFMLAIIITAVVAVFAKDFVVPFMALEDKKILDGWHGFFPLLGQEKGAFAIYVLMKIGLAMGSALIFGIIDFFVILGFLIPVGIVGVAAYFLAVGAGLTWNPISIGIVVVAGAVVVSLLLFIIAFISVPPMVFFQSYALHFLGSRYDLLGQAMTPREIPPAASLPSTAPIPVT